VIRIAITPAALVARLLSIWMLAVPTTTAAQIDASAGQILCEAWTRSGGDPSKQDNHAMMIQWVFGYLTGFAVLNHFA
jgi:hypothetical protein